VSIEYEGGKPVGSVFRCFVCGATAAGDLGYAGGVYFPLLPGGWHVSILVRHPNRGWPRAYVCSDECQAKLLH
jgi:hypothetical protein